MKEKHPDEGLMLWAILFWPFIALGCFLVYVMLRLTGWIQ